MLKILFLVFSIFLVACGNEDKDSPPNPSLQEKLTTKRNLYLNLVLDKLDSYGFYLSEDCDSLIFSTLLASTNATPFVPLAARDGNGAWFRRPINKPCYPESSDSTISRDHLLGLMFYAWRTKQLDILEQLYDYGVKNHWTMGDGPLTRTYFTFNMRYTLSEIIFRLGGTNHVVERNLPIDFSDVHGTDADLLVIHILLNGELTGKISDDSLGLLKIQHYRNPNNAFFSYAFHKYTDGDQTETYEQLLDTQYFPVNTLPTYKNYCTDWLWHRDQDNKDWAPCTDADNNDRGGEFLFVAGLLLGDGRNLGLNLFGGLPGSEVVEIIIDTDVPPVVSVPTTDDGDDSEPCFVGYRSMKFWYWHPSLRKYVKLKYKVKCHE